MQYTYEQTSKDFVMANFYNTTGSRVTRILFLSMAILKEFLTKLATVNWWGENSLCSPIIIHELTLEIV